VKGRDEPIEIYRLAWTAWIEWWRRRDCGRVSRCSPVSTRPRAMTFQRRTSRWIRRRLRVAQPPRVIGGV